MVRIDLWSDIACPWCWLGHAHLRQAAQRSGIPVEVAFHSFQLAPQQAKAEPVTEYLRRKYGDAGRIQDAHERLRSLGAEAGITYDFSKALAANTFDAHRLHHLAAERGVGEAAMERLFAAQHAEGADLSDAGVLRRIGTACGLAADDVDDMLASDRFAEAVREDLAAADQLGIHGVPFFVFERRLAVSGAQPVDVFVRALEQARDL